MKKIFMERPSVATTCSNTPSRTAARGGNKKYARDRGDEGGRFLRARVPRVSIQLYAPPRPPGAFSAGDAPFPAAAAVVVVVVVFRWSARFLYPCFFNSLFADAISQAEMGCSGACGGGWNKSALDMKFFFFCNSTLQLWYIP